MIAEKARRKSFTSMRRSFGSSLNRQHTVPLNGKEEGKVGGNKAHGEQRGSFFKVRQSLGINRGMSNDGVAKKQALVQKRNLKEEKDAIKPSRRDTLTRSMTRIRDRFRSHSAHSEVDHLKSNVQQKNVLVARIQELFRKLSTKREEF